ncbi:MAG: pitrilysin family protein [Geminicoccaceae bacterium]|nr:pitrilysin family protein [Geminicoccaceae bacterium]
MMRDRRLAGLLVAGAVAMTAALDVRAEPASPRVEEVVSPGGIKAYLLHEPMLPFLSLSLHFKGGAALDPAGKEGLAWMLSGLLDEGAGELDSQAFRTELEDKAIRLSFDAGRDEFTGQLRTLTEHRERAFELLGLALSEPRFDDEPVERIRSQVQADLRRRSEDPDYISSLTWFETAFPDHPYGRPVRGTVESVAEIGTADLERFVQDRLVKDQLTVGVAGDVTAEELGPLLDQAFGALPESGQPIEVATTEPAVAGTIVVRKPLPQSQVMFGEGGLPRDDPDYYAAYVANHILGGGGFTSRLTDEVREKRGLAYSVYSYLYPNDFAPLWLGGAGTDSTRVGESIEIIKAEIARIAAGEVTQEELDDAKTYLTGSFPLRLTSNDRIAGMLVGMQVHDLGPDYIDRRNELIEAVTLDDVRRVAGRLYDPEALLTVVVGDPAGS